MESSDDDVPLSALLSTTGASKSKSSTSAAQRDQKKKKKKKSKKNKKKKKVKREKNKSSSSSGRATQSKKRRSSSSKKPAAKRRKTQDTVRNKALSTVQQLDRAMKAHRWWEAAAMPKGQRWHSLEHHGINFQPPYQPHGVKMLYDGQPVDLTPVQEEIATHYAKVPPDGPQLGKPAVAKIFNKNFFACFRKALGRNHVIKKFEKCDFSPIRNMVLHEREVRKARTSEEKAAEKAEKLSTSLKYGYALVDGHVQKVGNFTIEPPGLFLGRGVHPKTGTVKTRTAPEEVTVNVGMDEAVPRCLVPGGAWGTVVSDNSVTWLGFWHENVMNGTKYVWLAASSGFKGQSDLAKYEKARKLKQYIGKIRADYQKNLRRKRIATKQLATAMWIIDILALRVGNEKDDDEADTVGCCSLRVEHLKFHEDTEGNEAGPFTLTLDFLGKDSMRHLQSIDFGEERFGEVGRKVFENLKSFCAKKKPSADVFDQLTVQELNDHLKTLMPGLSAKVFRTFNASTTLEAELPRDVGHLPLSEKVVLYNEANRKVAILCNHQRTVSAKFNESFAKMQGKRDLLQRQVAELEKMVKRIKKKKGIKLAPTKTPETREERAQISHLFKRNPSLQQVQNRLKTFSGRLANHTMAMKNKDDNKTVALGTSKINYMDPRITVAWCKQQECDISKVFPKALRDKFPWAMGSDMSFAF